MSGLAFVVPTLAMVNDGDNLVMATPGFAIQIPAFWETVPLHCDNSNLGGAVS